MPGMTFVITSNSDPTILGWSPQSDEYRDNPSPDGHRRTRDPIGSSAYTEDGGSLVALRGNVGWVG